MYRPPIPTCCIIGCKCNDILAHCKNCKLYFCYNHRQLIDSHEIVPSFSIYDNYYCCDFDCIQHYYIKCDICEELVINNHIRFDDKTNQHYCKYKCYKYNRN